MTTIQHERAGLAVLGVATVGTVLGGILYVLHHLSNQVVNLLTHAIK